MKINQLMDAIEQIDDRFVEEAAYGVRRKSHIPWGLVSAAACFCLVIGAAMLMQSMGILPHLSGTSNPTNHPITTEPSDTTEPTWSMAEYKERRAIQALFSEKDNWYCRALVAEFDSPANLPLRYYFYNSIEFGEGLQPTKEEIDELMAWEDYQKGKTLVILPVSKMDAVLTEVFAITVAEMNSKAFAGMKYVESIDSWCFWGGGILNAPEMMEDSLLPTVYVSGDTLRLIYRITNTSFSSYEMRLERYGDSYRILSNMSRKAMPEEYPELAEFFEIGSWKHRAILNRYSSPLEADIQSVLCRSYEGEQVILSDFEKEALQDMLQKLDGYKHVWRMTEDQINEILLSCWNITLDMVEFPVPYYIGGDAYVTPVYLEETGCWYGPGGYRGTESGYDEIALLKVEEADDGILNMYYTMPSQNYPAQWLARLKRNETGYYVLSVEWADWETPDETTVPTEPQKIRPSVEEFFSDREKWQNHLILATFSNPTQIDLRPYYLPPMNGESLNATALEHEKLSTVISGYDRNKLFRATKAQLDEIMLTLFNITTDQLTTDWESNFTYLEETGCYYSRAEDSRGYRVYIGSTEECEDGTILMYYSLSNNEDPYMLARLQPHETGYYILSNEPYADNTGKTEDQIIMEELFKVAGSWYNQALTCEYESPRQLNLQSFFYCGFPGEMSATDAEWAQLKDVNGFKEEKDFFRLPKDKMNAVLTEYFGITLDALEPECFSGLAYLESTNCYYFMTTSTNYIPDFQADKVVKKSDGTIDIYYNISYLGDYVVTVKPNGGGYRILSNLLAESSRPYAVNAAQLDALLQEVGNGSVSDAREKEIALPLLGTFLENPELFLDRLEKQFQIREAVVQILNREVQYPHPRYTAYKKTIQSLLTTVRSEEDKEIVYMMAFYNGLYNYLPQTPDAQDYVLLFDMMLYADGAFSESGSDWLERYCKADPKAFTAAMALTAEENWSHYAQHTVMYAAQEERTQIKESMNRLVTELSALSGDGVQNQIKCAQLIAERCDKPIV